MKFLKHSFVAITEKVLRISDHKLHVYPALARICHMWNTHTHYKKHFIIENFVINQVV